MTPQEPETSAFPAQPEHHPAVESPRRRRAGLAVLLFVLLMVGAVALGVWIYGVFLRGGADQSGPGGAQEAPTVSTVTTTVTPGPTPAPDATYRAPDSAVQCAATDDWRIFRANGQTSCGLAKAVSVEMEPYSGDPDDATVVARSPVTGLDYEMVCRGQGGNSFVCEGGDNAVVILEGRSGRD